MVSLLCYFASDDPSLLELDAPGDDLDIDQRDFRSFLRWFEQLDVSKYEQSEMCIPTCDVNHNSKTSNEKLTVNGKITNIFGDGHGLVDHHIYFSMKDVKDFNSTDCPNVGDSVLVDAERSRSDAAWRAVHVIPVKKDTGWNEDDAQFRVVSLFEEKGSLIGTITSYDSKEQCGTIENDITFKKSDLHQGFSPYVGDWVQSKVNPGGAATDVAPLRSKEFTGRVSNSSWDQQNQLTGAINNEVFFDSTCCLNSCKPRRGDEVTATAIESHQDRFGWRATAVALIQRRRHNQETIGTQKPSWVLSGDRPKQPGRPAALPSFLPKYSIPDSLLHCVVKGGNLLGVRTVLKESLLPVNYHGRFSTLLHLEEIAVLLEIETYKLKSVSLTIRGEFLVLIVPGISDGRPSLVEGDCITLHNPQASQESPEHRGFIHHIYLDTEEILLKFHHHLHKDFDESAKFDVSFSYSRLPLRRCHLAIQFAKQNYIDLLFPKQELLIRHPMVDVKLVEQEDGSCKLVSKGKNKTTKFASFVNPSLNDRQKKFVVRMLCGEARPKPYILFGPPGTGKTVTLVETIVQVLNHLPSCRLLICAPSNSAVDLLCERLHASGCVSTESMVRFNAFRRPQQAIPECVQRYCHPKEELTTTSRYKVVLSTCVNTGMFYTLQLPFDHFSHVYIDEAGQATEPECLIPIGLGAKGQIVLTGDPEQLGPVLKSQYAIHFGLNMSLLERLMLMDDYKRNMKMFDEGYDDRLVTKLVHNYRSHSAIVSLSSRLFYHNELKASADEKLQNALCSWEHLPVKGFPVFFHGIVGQELREDRCPSFFNAAEIVQVVQYVKFLLHSGLNVRPCDIGVITPYRKQVEKLRLMLKTLFVKNLKVGSVEEFQGQERKVIILSTVRSKPAEELQNDNGCIRSMLGFVSSPKRFNVALTRAQSLLIVIGNPHVLSKDEHWKMFLQYCIENKSCVGCNI